MATRTSGRTAYEGTQRKEGATKVATKPERWPNDWPLPPVTSMLPSPSRCLTFIQMLPPAPPPPVDPWPASPLACRRPSTLRMSDTFMWITPATANTHKVNFFKLFLLSTYSESMRRRWMCDVNNVRAHLLPIVFLKIVLSIQVKIRNFYIRISLMVKANSQ